jgi:hypothetical protein
MPLNNGNHAVLLPLPETAASGCDSPPATSPPTDKAPAAAVGTTTAAPYSSSAATTSPPPPPLVSLALTARDLPSLSHLARAVVKDTSHTPTAAPQARSGVAGIGGATTPAQQHACSVSDEDVLKDAEALLWGDNSHHGSSTSHNNGGSRIAIFEKCSATSGSGYTGSLTALARSLFEKERTVCVASSLKRGEVCVAELLSVNLGEPPTEAVPAIGVFSDAWTEGPASIPARTSLQRCNSVQLSSPGRKLQANHRGERGPPVLTSSIGPVAPYTVARERLEDDDDNESAFLTTQLFATVARDALPLLVASEEAEPASSGPNNWRDHSLAAARAAATKAAAGVTEVAAAQVPGGAIAVATVSKGAEAVPAGRGANFVSCVTQLPSTSMMCTTVAAATPATTPSSPPEAVDPLASTAFNNHVRATVTAATTRRQQQLKLYVTQNFVPTLSDFIPGSNDLVERAAIKTKTWATARKEAATGRGQGMAVVSAEEAATVPVPTLRADESVWVGSPSPDTRVMHVKTEEWYSANTPATQNPVTAAQVDGEDVTVIVDDSNSVSHPLSGSTFGVSHVTPAKATLTSRSPEQVQKDRGRGDDATAATAATVPTITATTAIVTKEEVAAVTRAPGGGIVPYATIRVLLCHCNDGARNGNNAVDAFEKFRRMPCRRKLQELLGNFAYNLLPHPPNKGKKSSPFREVQQMHAQHNWSGTDAAVESQVDGRPPVLEPVGVVKGITGKKITSAPTTSVLAKAERRRSMVSALSVSDSPATTGVTALPCSDDSAYAAVNPLLPPSAAVRRASHGETSGAPTPIRDDVSQTFVEEDGAGRPDVQTHGDALANLPQPSTDTAAYYAYMTYGQRTVLYNARYGMPELRNWSRTYPCCSSPATLREGCCCLHCQLSRQCNVLNYRRPTVLWPLCCLICILDPCTCLMCSSVLACLNRATVRARYGIEGSFLGDCLCTLLCTRCVAAQVMDEMIVHDEYPGGLCMLPPMASPGKSTLA